MGLKICKDEEKGFFRVNEGKLGQRAWKLIKKSPKEAIFSLFFFFFFSTWASRPCFALCTKVSYILLRFFSLLVPLFHSGQNICTPLKRTDVSVSLFIIETFILLSWICLNSFFNKYLFFATCFPFLLRTEHMYAIET